MENTPKLQWHDYILLVGMLAGCSLIGLYFKIVASRKTTAAEFFLGGKTMGSFPVAMSLTACFISATVFTVLPAEIYQFGITLGLTAFTFQLVLAFIYFAVLPVFYDLQIVCVHEYLELRFNKKLRCLASSLYAITMIFTLPVIIYVPALILSHGTGVSVHLLTIIICVICIFYTTIGGLKAVIWTDTLQFFLMILNILVMVVLGSITTGGMFKVLESSREGQRLKLDFDFDPTKRDTVWTVSIGYGLYWMQNTMTNQVAIQKFMALPNMATIKRSIIMYGISIGIILSLVVYMGLIIYAEFKDCDPFISKKISSYDQIVPYYILHITGNIPGLAGLFNAGILSAGLSSLSAYLNGLACTIYEDLIKPNMRKANSDKATTIILSSTVVIVGMICTGLVFVIEKMGSLFPILISSASISSGPILGLYILGLFSTKANPKAAISGVIGSILTMSWIVLGAQYYKLEKVLVYDTLPVSSHGCKLTHWKPFYIYRISFYYYCIMGALIVLIIGLPVGWITAKKEDKVKRELISPVIRWINKIVKYSLVRKSNTTEQPRNGEY